MKARPNLKILLVMWVFIFLGLATGKTYGKYGGGSGTASDPYLIYTAEHLNTLGLNPADWGKHFKLMADIDMALSGTKFNCIGNWAKTFTGVFDGNGHTIYNFEPADSCASGLSGLFGSMTGAVRNLTLVNPCVQCLNTSSDFQAGLLVGLLYSGTITNCHIIGGYIEKDFPPLPRYASYGDIGGLVGSLYEDAAVSDCSVKDTTIRGDFAGGVAGENRGIIRDCTVNNINIDGGWEVGGIIGRNLGTVERCAAAGVIRAEAFGGGIVGTVPGPPPDHPYDPVVRECYSSCSVWSNDLAGGLAGGASNKCLIIDCYTIGSVNGFATAGLVSRLGNYLGATPQIVNCYAAASVAGSRRGGLINHTYLGGGPVKVVNSFWDIEASGVTYSACGIGKTTAQMQTKNTFTSAGWDFTTPIWTIYDGHDYPRLWWESFPRPWSLEFAGFNIIERTRIGRTVFRYVLSLSLTNVTHTDITDAHIKLVNASEQVTNVIEDEIYFPLIEAYSTVDSNLYDDWFIIQVDRSEPIAQGTLTWKIDYSQTDNNVSKMQIMSADLPVSDTVGDLTGNNTVGFSDLAVLVEQWLGPPGAPSADIAPEPDGDGTVNLLDFAQLAENWWP